METKRWSDFVEYTINKNSYEPARNVLKVLKFENFQNITRVHKLRNTLAFIRFPILYITRCVISLVATLTK